MGRMALKMHGEYTNGSKVGGPSEPFGGTLKTCRFHRGLFNSEFLEQEIQNRASKMTQMFCWI